MKRISSDSKKLNIFHCFGPITEWILCAAPLAFNLIRIQHSVDNATFRFEETSPFSSDRLFKTILASLMGCTWLSLIISSILFPVTLFLVRRERRSQGYTCAGSLPLLFVTSLLYHTLTSLTSSSKGHGVSWGPISSEKTMIVLLLYSKVLLLTIFHQLQRLVMVCVDVTTAPTRGMHESNHVLLKLKKSLINLILMLAVALFGSYTLVASTSDKSVLEYIRDKGYLSYSTDEMIWNVAFFLLFYILISTSISALITIMTGESMSHGERFLISTAASIHLGFGIEFFLLGTSPHPLFFPSSSSFTFINWNPFHFIWSHPSPILVFSWALLWGMVSIGLVTSPVLIYAAHTFPSLKSRLLSFLFFMIFGFMVFVPLKKWSYHWIGVEPFLWTIGFILDPFSGRCFITLFWICFVLFGIGWIVTSVQRKTNDIQLDGRRKYFHVMICIMLTPVCFFDLNYQHVALSVAFAAMLLVEYLRLGNIWPFAPSLDFQLRLFLDDRDSGPLFLSHFYLVLGCAFPVWNSYLLHPSDRIHPLIPISGILALGLGDTFASSIGKRFGTLKWPASVKSVQGTLGFVLGLGASCTGLHWFLGETNPVSYLTVFGMCILTGLLEAVSDQNDNLILPVYFMSLLMSSVGVTPTLFSVGFEAL